MNLTDALAAVAPAVGDGKLIPQHAYVLAAGRKLQATDGSQWAHVPLESGEAFCVRYEALKRALERDGMTTMVSDGQNGLKASYGRGRAHLKGVSPDTFPALQRAAIEGSYSLPPDFTNHIQNLLPFCGGTDAHVWQQAVHIRPGLLFAANSYALIKCPTQWDSYPRIGIGIPTWACRFIAGQDGCPTEFRTRGQMISFVWPNQVELFSTLLTQEAPESIREFAAQLNEPDQEIPEGLKESIARLKSYGAKTCKIGDGKLIHATEEIDIEDDLEISGSMRTWGVDSLSAALEHATTLHLGDQRGIWKGSGYVGVFAGRSD